MSQGDNAVAQSERHGMCSVNRAELSHRGTCMLVDGSLCDMKNFTDLPSRLATGHPPENLDLARGECVAF